MTVHWCYFVSKQTLKWAHGCVMVSIFENLSSFFFATPVLFWSEVPADSRIKESVCRINISGIMLDKCSICLASKRLCSLYMTNQLWSTCPTTSKQLGAITIFLPAFIPLIEYIRWEMQHTYLFHQQSIKISFCSSRNGFECCVIYAVTFNLLRRLLRRSQIFVFTSVLCALETPFTDSTASYFFHSGGRR